MDHRAFFFQKLGLTNRDLERYLAAALSAGGDYADLYFEYHTSTSVSLDESLIKSATQGISAGCGVRVISGERTGYAYTDDLAPERILRAARTAALIASGPNKQPIASLQDPTGGHTLYAVAAPSVDAAVGAEGELLHPADRKARGFESRILQVRA